MRSSLEGDTEESIHNVINNWKVEQQDLDKLTLILAQWFGHISGFVRGSNWNYFRELS
jgi:hypothetical protein